MLGHVAIVPVQRGDQQLDAAGPEQPGLQVSPAQGMVLLSR